ncbi:MAG: TIGR03936 family radical SAM-associated protein [Candidatus Saganbacteria bacterium]|nr:TIGR03936 family radical SAM-associated protein [Candidatus Saganbacteria bacterium]
MQRIRIKYKKGEEVRFLSHKNIMRVFERAIRRADISITYSQGFNPHMKISYGLPLKVGHTGNSEFADLFIDDDTAAQSVKEKLNEVLPTGVEILEAGPVDLKAPSIASSSKSN